MGNLSDEPREQNREDKVTRFRSVTYIRQLGLLVNTLGSHPEAILFRFLFTQNIIKEEMYFVLKNGYIALIMQNKNKNNSIIISDCCLVYTLSQQPTF